MTLVVLTIAASGCASFKPTPVADVPFRDRALHGGGDLYPMEVAVLGPAEARKIFDRKLDKKDIQPVWICITNRDVHKAFLLPRAIDPEYYSPLEAAYQYHSMCRPGRNERMDAWFLTNSIPIEIPAGQARSGFVFTHVDLGGKHLNIALLSSNGLDRFSFVPDVPGLSRDWEAVDWEDLARSVEVIDCDEAQLREELERLPRAATNKAGTKEADPLNLVVIANAEDLEAFIWAGWTETERITSRSAWRTFKSFLFGSKYLYSPISSLYVFGRSQDIALQKTRGSVHLRNHLRLWATPFRFAGKHVWIGQISRDIGVRWTLKTANLTTHKIDPDVDESRNYLLQDLLLSQGVARFGTVPGVEPASLDAPRANLTGDPYYTDGRRAVIELTTTQTDINDVKLFGWTPSAGSTGE